MTLHRSNPSLTSSVCCWPLLLGMVFLSSTAAHALRVGTFPQSDPPFLAAITEPDACMTKERVCQTLDALEKTISGIDLISVRVDSNNQPALVTELVRRLVHLSGGTTTVVVSSDWVEAAIQGGAHGIHVKESHRPRIPEIRRQFVQAGIAVPPLLGTSAHSLESARAALAWCRPDYLFVGTCYETPSHPEKSASDLEGPGLPGRIARDGKVEASGCPVLAIGGITADNCAEPVLLGASGVAVIRAILQAHDPADAVRSMRQSMTKAHNERIQQSICDGTQHNGDTM